MCIETVRYDGELLKDVRWDELNLTKEQIYILCLIAVKQNGLALQYVKNPTEDIYIEALKQDRHLIRYIKDKDRYLEEFDIKYFKKQGKARDVIAIEEDGEWLFTIGCQTDIDKETFIDRIYNEGRGFDPEKGINLHRQVYLNFLKDFY
ncbi:hypothetical protein ACP3VA_12150 [Clostridioides difficile]